MVWLVFNIIISGGAYHVQNGNISREAVTITSTPIVHNAQTDQSYMLIKPSVASPSKINTYYDKKK